MSFGFEVIEVFREFVGSFVVGPSVVPQDGRRCTNRALNVNRSRRINSDGEHA